MTGRGAVVVGTGFGARIHVPALRAAGFEPVALVGRDAEKTARRAVKVGAGLGTTDLAVLERDDVELVTVATPPDAHAEVVHAAVAAGKHVVCEKPFALDADEAAAMLDAADAAGVVHALGHEFRFAEARATARRALVEGVAGEPQLATFVGQLAMLVDGRVRMPGWWFDPARGGGWLGASGSHLVDQVRHWLGEVVAVSGRLTHVAEHPQGPGDDGFAALLHLASGATAVLTQTASAHGPPVEVARVVGDAGTVWVADGAAWSADAGGERELPVPDDLQLPPPPQPGGTLARFTHLELPAYTRLLERIRDAIDGRPAVQPPFATFADGTATQRILDAIRASDAAGGARVEVDQLADSAAS